jgi:hypothetical protein
MPVARSGASDPVRSLRPTTTANSAAAKVLTVGGTVMACIAALAGALLTSVRNSEARTLVST